MLWWEVLFFLPEKNLLTPLLMMDRKNRPKTILVGCVWWMIFYCFMRCHPFYYLFLDLLYFFGPETFFCEKSFHFVIPCSLFDMKLFQTITLRNEKDFIFVHVHMYIFQTEEVYNDQEMKWPIFDGWFLVRKMGTTCTNLTRSWTVETETKKSGYVCVCKLLEKRGSWPSSKSII